MLLGDISSTSSPNVMSQTQSSEMSTPEKSNSNDHGKYTKWILLNIKLCLHLSAEVSIGLSLSQSAHQ